MEQSTSAERLHKRIAAAGVCSRRAAEDMIRDGRVTVNGDVVTQMGVKVGPDDVVAVDGKELATAKLTYILMNKPAGYLTTMSDPRRRPTVVNLLPKLDVVVKPCGRLDQDTEGLLIFTNDGLFAQRLTHPRFAVEKEYAVVVEGVPSEAALQSLSKGVYIEGGRTAPATVTLDHASDSKSESFLRLIIHEGRKRQVRMMCEAVGHPVKSLRRIRIGPITLHKLPRGACRLLSVVEVDKLKRLVGMVPSREAPRQPDRVRPKRPASVPPGGPARKAARPRAGGPKRRTKPSS